MQSSRGCASEVLVPLLFFMVIPARAGLAKATVARRRYLVRCIVLLDEMAVGLSVWFVVLGVSCGWCDR